jgi:cytochrome c551/c552
MDFLKGIATPLSPERFRLIIVVASVSSMIFFAYLGFVISSSFFSIFFNYRGRKGKNNQYIRLSRMLINTAIYNKSMAAFLGIIPGFSLVFSYVQILQDTPVAAVSFAGTGFICFCTGLALLYSYKYTFRIRSFFESYRITAINATEDSTDIDSYRKDNIRTHLFSGRWGSIFLAISLVLYTAALSMTMDSENWNSASHNLDLFLSVNLWVKILMILAGGACLTSMAMLMVNFNPELKTGRDEIYDGLVRATGLRWSAISLFVLPASVILNIASSPAAGASGSMYTLAGIAVLSVLAAGNIIYAYYRKFEAEFLRYGLVMCLIAVIMPVAGDYIALNTAAGEQSELLALKESKIMEDLNASYGMAAEALTGEEIYSARCSSCHLFDIKKIGPPYFETIPKYKGDKNALAEFVLNPVPRNPAYPPMSNPGLRRIEADSVAAFLIRTVAAGKKP